MYRATRARRPLNLDVTTATTQSFAFIHSYLEVLVMIATGATPVLIGRWPHSFIPSNERTHRSYPHRSYMERHRWTFSH